MGALRIGIIGCGKIADAHAGAISMIPGAKIVGACDIEPLMARQFTERFNVKRYFHDITEMLESIQPDVVHITTPPQSQHEIGILCLEAGCHVFIEKPFTLNFKQASEIIGMAEAADLKVTTGTDEQFSHVAIRMRKLMAEGYLGGPPLHMDVYYCYDLGDERYARVFLANKNHWVRKLPGQLMHNIISHGIAKIAEYLQGDEVEVIAHGFTSEFLKKIGENELIDELRVIIHGAKQTTAYFTFSTQMRPPLREFRIFGPKNGLILDQDHHALIKVRGESYKSYADKLIPLNTYARQYRRNMLANACLFLKRDFHMKAGLKNLIERFYRSIEEKSSPPIPYTEILLTARILDSIFSQVYEK
ncbi:MAG: Gfo/Idh/MocA family oxidoreductase [Thermoplasmata archaeon]|nr:Gfo/Idh/MocA family oxidoreductase [Thermoplasmata archaeon]